MERKTRKCQTLQSFWNKCYIKRGDNKIGNFRSRVDEDIFVGYSWNIKAYGYYNLGLKNILERINVKIDESSWLKTKKECKNTDILED